MTRQMILAAAVSAFALAGCNMNDPATQTAAGAVGGAAAGLIAAEALNANDNWSIVAALAGAAAGTMVAQNSMTKQCAYSRGDGTYYTAPCPAGY